ncbi:MAG: autotransporter domain-containing protein [Verrucomicrobiota bacterium]|nr:autotransporter domain-containing protein [Verrucomicrobiota bacterium]
MSFPISLLLLATTCAVALEVTSLADRGPGTLREAMLVSSPDSVITFDVQGTIFLENPLPTVTENLTVQGNGKVVLNGQSLHQILRIDSGAVSISDMTFLDGASQGEDGGSGSASGGGGGLGSGGAIGVSSSGSIRLTHVTFASNAAVGGSGGNPISASAAVSKGSRGGEDGAGTRGESGEYGCGGGGGGNPTPGRSIVFGGAGGAGGFAAGGGGGGCNAAGGRGGVLGGDGGADSGGGGGGAGLGGALYLQRGAVAYFDGVHFAENSATGGEGGDGATSGMGIGDDLFLDAGSAIHCSTSPDEMMEMALSGGGSFVHKGAGTVVLMGQSVAAMPRSGKINALSGVVDMDGLFSQDVTIGSTGLVKGSAFVSSVKNDGILSVGHSVGAFLMDGGYTQGPDGTLQLFMTSSPNAGPLDASLLSANGPIEFSPGSQLYISLDETNLYFKGQQIPLVVSQQAIYGTPSIATSIDYFPFQLIVDPDPALIGLVAQNRVGPYGLNFSGAAGDVQTFLRESNVLGNEGLIAFFNEINGLSNKELRTLLANIGPSAYGAINWADFFALAAFSDLLTERNRLSCTLCTAPVCCPCSAKKEASAAICPVTKEGLRVWIDGMGDFGNQMKMNDLPGFTTALGGVYLGADYRFLSGAGVGLATGYSYEWLDWKSGLGDANMNSGYAALYGSYSHPLFYLDVSLFGSGESIHTNRNYPPFSLRSTSAHTGWSGGGKVGVGVPVAMGDWALTPFAESGWFYAWQDEFVEQGEEPLGFHVDSSHSSWSRSFLGARAEGTFCLQSGILIPCFQVSWLYIYPLSDNTVTARWPFNTESLSVSTTTAPISQAAPHASIRFIKNDQMEFALVWDGEYDMKRTENTVQFLLARRF